ncbi:hypothetical protein GALMADRAFT_151619 [Galerina marginata CBS 339.88]|uniref:Uncharacterized protein n=1 Tax=Galerina marginata (strain CBS 339.88) TaxID=685588 RepID=A0A067THC7_GALM3|nr:hypothetical protein GALMADRAFT_151619 [Galerina marginata CBS 339.88]
MSYPASPSSMDTNHPIDRIDSSETTESPFGSNLVTPTDKETYQTGGIHERLDLAKTISGYFASRSNSMESSHSSNENPLSDVIKLKISSEALIDASKGPTRSVFEGKVDVETDVADITVIPSNAFDSMEGLPSPLSSLSSSDSFRRVRAGSIYNLPNDHIVVDTPPKSLIDTGKIQPDEDDILESMKAKFVPLLQKTDASSDSWIDLTAALSDSFRDVLVPGLRVLFFFPWCVAVGGALVAGPKHLDWLVFGTGYIEHLSGIRRYSHLAEYGFQHIVAFFAFVAAVLWQYPDVGCLATGAFLGHFFLAWHDFLLDHTIPLGNDDRHTVYLLATTTWFNHDNTISIKKVEETYYWTDHEPQAAEELDTDSD